MATHAKEFPHCAFRQTLDVLEGKWKFAIQTWGEQNQAAIGLQAGRVHE